MKKIKKFLNKVEIYRYYFTVSIRILALCLLPFLAYNLYLKTILG